MTTQEFKTLLEHLDQYTETNELAVSIFEDPQAESTQLHTLFNEEQFKQMQDSFTETELNTAQDMIDIIITGLRKTRI